MPKFFGRRSNNGFVGPFGSFFGCFALIAAGAGATFLLGACESVKKVSARQSTVRAMRRARVDASPRIAASSHSRLGLSRSTAATAPPIARTRARDPRARPRDRSRAPRPSARAIASPARRESHRRRRSPRGPSSRDDPKHRAIAIAVVVARPPRLPHRARARRRSLRKKSARRSARAPSRRVASARTMSRL